MTKGDDKILNRNRIEIMEVIDWRKKESTFSLHIYSISDFDGTSQGV